MSFKVSLCVLFISVSAFAKVTFTKGTLTIENKTVPIELAKSEDQRSHGLMYRKSLAQNAGMLFVFDKEETLTFWMKNTLIPLSIGYFDRDQRLVDIHEMEPLSDKRIVYTSKKPALYALEMNKGWFTKNKIKVGSKFTYQEK